MKIMGKVVPIGSGLDAQYVIHQMERGADGIHSIMVRSMYNDDHYFIVKESGVKKYKHAWEIRNILDHHETFLSGQLKQMKAEEKIDEQINCGG